MHGLSFRQLTVVVASFSLTLAIISSLCFRSGPQILLDVDGSPAASIDANYHGPEAGYSSDSPGSSTRDDSGDEWWSGWKSGISKIATHWGLSPERMEQVAKIRLLSQRLQEYYTIEWVQLPLN
jgi:hypothetical protein